MTIPAHGGQLRQIAVRFGVTAGDLLDFSANINPAGPPQFVLAAVRDALADPAMLAAYPDLESTALKQAIANYSIISPAQISVANGFVPLLDAALRSLRIRHCLLPVPSFSEYRRTLENSGISVIPFQLSPNQNFRYQPDLMMKQCLQSGCDAILLANPQNPSGVAFPAKEMEYLIESAVRHGIAILLDEAFVDYCPDYSLIKVAVECPRMIVFRSVTKFFAIPGLRVAYAISRGSVVETMNRALSPWPIASFASNAVCAALQDQAYANESCRINQRRRAWLQEQLASLKVTIYPASANFLLLQFSESIDVSKLWQRMITEQQIVLRSCANFEGLSTQYLRIAVRSEPDNARLVHALEQMLPRSQRLTVAHKSP
jgi:threonine-phosphate decarboxylase